MKNPFPGMNPYLQQRWGDFHTRFTVAMSDAINQSLPSDLEARIEESITVDFADERRTIYPDVNVFEQCSGSSVATAMATASTVSVAEPTFVRLRDDPRTERHIEILDLKTGGRVITAIELLSPANKSSEGREAYRKKQAEFIAARVNLVEIDLIRGGHFVLAMPERKLPRKCHTPYLINIRRATRRDEAALHPITLREPLPNIRIPLRPTDSDIVLQLQPLVDECYERGRYRLNYQQPPDPPLTTEEDAWVDQLLRERGLRT
ncbi:MAG: DUF4058 family protein [Planctomycetaceae bacterium]